MQRLIAALAATLLLAHQAAAQSVGGAEVGMSGSGSSKQFKVRTGVGGPYGVIADIDAIAGTVKANQGFLAGVPIGSIAPALGTFTAIEGIPAANQSTTSAKNVQRVRARTFIGHALDANDGGDYFHTQGKDWLESLVQGSTSKGNLGVLSEPGVTTGIVAGSRTSDSALIFDYAFAAGLFGVNDQPFPQRTMITDYNETRTYAGAGTSQNIESDAINSGGSFSTLSPYGWANNLPATMNLWLSSGRPDIELVHLGGTVTVGNTIQLRMTPSGGSTVSVTYTVVTGDTLATIATGLASLVNAATPFTSTSLYAAAVNTTVSIGNNVSTTTWATTLSGGATETVVLDRGSPTSTGIGLINNCNNQDCGRYVTGIFFDANSLLGTDGSDGSTGLGEAIAFARNQTLNFYHANGAGVSGTASVLGASVYSTMTSTAPNRFNLVFRNDATAITNGTTGTDIAKFTTAGLSVAGVLAAGGDIYPAQAVTFAPVTVASLPPCNPTNKDRLWAVTDAGSPTYNATITGGSTFRIPVYCDGANWRAH